MSEVTPSLRQPGRGRLRRLFEEDNRVATVFFLVALALYGPGIFWGLPHATAADRVLPWGLDEIAPLGLGEPYFALIGDLRRFDPRYPLFHYVVQAIVCGPYVVWLAISGGWTGMAREFPFGFTDPVAALRNLTLIGRLPSVVMGAGVVAAACATRPFAGSDRRLDVLIGLFVLSITPMFFYAATSNVDVPALFWTALGLVAVSRALRDGLTLRRAVWIGLFAALATGTKDAYYTVFAGVLPPLFLLHARARRGEGAGWGDALKAPATCVAAGAVAYAVCSGLIVNPTRFARHTRFITHGSPISALRGHYGSVPPTLEGYLHALRATVDETAMSLGTVGLALALLGIALCARRDRRALVFALPVLTLVAGVILPVRFVELRFLLPMAYVLAFFAAYAVWTASRSASRAARVAGALACVVALGVQFAKAGDLGYQRIVDRRYALASWFSENVRASDRVAAIDGAFRLPPLPAEIVTVDIPRGAAAERFLETERPEFVVVIPFGHRKHTHELVLPEHVYQRLRDGSLGYKQVLGVGGQSLIPGNRFVLLNPPVKVFARSDQVSRLGEHSVRVEIAE
jgi:hypothetical protein